MVDNGSALNLLPKRTLLTVGLTLGHIKYNSLVIRGLTKVNNVPSVLIKTHFLKIEDFIKS